MFIQIIALNQISNAQTISPYTINNGGGFSSSIEWSMGESVSIAHFTTPNLNLNTGVLQPLSTVVTAINDFGPTIFGNSIVIGPNPTSKNLHFKAELSQFGKIIIQLIDTKSIILNTVESGSMVNNFSKVLELENYPAGILYLRVQFKPIVGATKSGIYKIIKL
jgi:hypothetical protein